MLTWAACDGLIAKYSIRSAHARRDSDRRRLGIGGTRGSVLAEPKRAEKSRAYPITNCFRTREVIMLATPPLPVNMRIRIAPL